MSELLFIPSVIRTSTTEATKLTDEVLRLRETKSAIYFNIQHGHFNKLVIVDGSNTDIFSDKEIDEIESRGIQVEQLKFQQSREAVQKYGKSYGEMTITNYMLENSKLANESGGFVKISGRYNFVNASDILPKIASYNTFFVNYHPRFIRKLYPYTATIFYKTSNDFFRKYLSDCGSECNNDLSGYLESVFFRRLIGLKRNNLLVPYAYFSGISGVTGSAIIDQHLRKRKILSSLGFLSFSCDSLNTGR
jgi:hypothetical protein